MDNSDWFEAGAGLGMGLALSRSLGGSLLDAMDTRTSMAVLTVPQTRAEIENFLDLLDVRLAHGQISEATYARLYDKWSARLEAAH